MKPLNIKAALNLVIASTAAAFIAACSFSGEPEVIVVTATPQPTPVVVTATPAPTLVVQLSVEPGVEVEPKPAPLPAQPGTLIKSSGSDIFYLTAAGTRRPLHDRDTWLAFGFRPTDIVIVAAEALVQLPQGEALSRLVFDNQDNLYWVAAGRRWQVNAWKRVVERADYAGLPATPLDDLLLAALPVQAGFDTGTLLRAGQVVYYVDGDALIPVEVDVPAALAVIDVPVDMLAAYEQKAQLDQTLVRLKADTPAANVRQDPQLLAEVIGVVQNPAKIVALGRTPGSDWLQIIYQGQPGWLAADLAVETVGLGLLPVISPTLVTADLPQAEPAAVVESSPPQPLFCPEVPIRGFGKVWGERPEVKNTLGCADSWQGGEQGTQAAVQIFQNGLMVWLQADGYDSGDPVYVFFADGSFQRFGDLGPADPAKIGLVPAGFYEVGDKFGKVYWEGTGAQVKERLGYALGPTRDSAGAFQQFSNGRMFWTEALDRIFVVYEYGYLEGNNYIQIRTWHSYEDTF
ncbi:MAG TPA: SH3 domain-containing protein [Anaerolineae bacterium]|nr:SH3 domain-containing protein [Anaerolineae bacterium]